MVDGDSFARPAFIRLPQLDRGLRRHRIDTWWVATDKLYLLAAVFEDWEGEEREGRYYLRSGKTWWSQSIVEWGVQQTRRGCPMENTQVGEKPVIKVQRTMLAYNHVYMRGTTDPINVKCFTVSQRRPLRKKNVGLHPPALAFRSLFTVEYFMLTFFNNY